MYISELVGPRDEDEKFLVFYRGDMVRSVRGELPPVRGRAFERRIARSRAEHPDAEFGWFAYRPEPREHANHEARTKADDQAVNRSFAHS